MTRDITPVILSGGGGTRLWPLSRAAYPKQLLALGGGRSLLQETLLRVAGPGFAAPLVICNDDYRFLVAQQLQDLGAEGQVILEPVGRNTAPAAAVAALYAGRADPEALLLILPSDHAIADVAGFHAMVAAGAGAAAAGWLVTFGVTPDRAETGYGYVKRAEPLDEAPGCFRVERFVEKPGAETAAAYLAGGDFAWNSGMFLVSARALLEEMVRLAPAIVTAGEAALAASEQDLDFLRLDAEAFAKSPSISLDHAVMEKTERAATVPVDIGWSDVGSWDALWRISLSDQDGNTLVGDVVSLDSTGSYLHSEKHLLAALGVKDLAVVATADAVMVCPRERAQEVRDLVALLDRAERPEAAHHRRVYRPWGSYESIDMGEGFQVKRLILLPGASISLQRHRHRSEHWVVVRGTAEVTRDEDTFELRANESSYIPVGAVHRLRNPGEEALHIIEVQCGDYLGEDDIERFEDIYGRA
jgi:mannose-1-phosphate guanylyltransferase / mannose-6-phosphate isomerase